MIIMNTRSVFASAFLLLTPFALPASASENPITLQIDVRSVAELGDELRPFISLTNTSDNVVSVSRFYSHNDTLPAQLRVSIARGASCTATLLDFRTDGTPSAALGNLIPLYPGERFTLAPQPLNVNVMWQEIWAEPGAAILRVEYRTGQADGSVSRAEVPIHFVDPPADRVRENRERLATCVLNGGLQCERLIAYFAAVKDDQAADLLLQLLGLRPYMSYIAKAIANQGRPGHADALEDIAANNPAADARFLTEMANRIRRRAEMRCEDPVPGARTSHARSKPR